MISVPELEQVPVVDSGAAITSMEVVRSEEQRTWSFASPFMSVLQNNDFICVPTKIYCLNLNSFIGIAVKFAQSGVFGLQVQATAPEQTPCSRPVKEHLLRISFFLVHLRGLTLPLPA